MASGTAFLYGTLKPKSTYEYQRESALRFRNGWANVEQIRFEEEGNKPGLGASWRANAVATIDGKDYEGTIGTHTTAIRQSDSPRRMPALPSSASPRVLTVI